MDMANVWTITTKDLHIMAKKKYILYTLLIVPIMVTIALPLVMGLVMNKSNVPTSNYTFLVDSFAFIYVLLACFLPISVASYSFVGEKLEKSLEPLLATPSTDSEILLGKSLAAFLPSIIMLYASSVVFMALMDYILGFWYYPNWNMAITWLLIFLNCIFSIEFNVIVSAQVNDVRAAQNIGFLVVIPLLVTYLMSEFQVITLDPDTLLIIAAIFAGLDTLMFFLSTAVFRRDKILTMWK